MKLIVFIYLIICAIVISALLYGIFLTFAASLILGGFLLLITPLYTVFGIIGFLGHPELANLIVKFLNLPF
jgi:hypothetical protein